MTQQPVRVVKGADLEVSGGQTPGMSRSIALANVSDQLCGSLMIAQPHTSSGIHHHGAQDTIVYAVKGTGALVSDNGNTRQELRPGDWALIPAGTDHQECNTGDEEVVWVIVRGGREAEVVNVGAWTRD